MLKEERKFDCRYFNGAKPCGFTNACNKCNSYNPMGKRILIIKLASAGDVLRTTPILPALKKKYPQSFITWLTKEPAHELLAGNPHIDRILIFGLESVLSLQVEKFDSVISLDKAAEAVSIASLVKAQEKYGFGLDEKGKIYPFNKEAEYSFLLGLDNDLKFHRNKKTYQKLIFEIVNLTYAGERYELKLGTKELDFAVNFFNSNKLNNEDLVIGINTGAGRIFAGKNLRPERMVRLIGLLNSQLNAKILLLGGPLEQGINEYIIKNSNLKISDSGCSHSLKEFAALINKCSLIITADTLALHIAIALNRPVVALFGPTCPAEIEMYNRGRKIVSGAECAPCYKNICDRQSTCMDKISLEEIVKAAKGLIGSDAANTI